MSEQFQNTVAGDSRADPISCPRCQGQMVLTRTRPAIRGRDLHMFECTGCDFGQVLAVNADDPDGATTWILGAVRPR